MADQHFLYRIIKPQDCALCFGIPTDLDGFRVRKDRQNSIASQSMTQIDGYLDVLNEVMPTYLKLGVGIFDMLTLEKFHEVLNRGFGVVTLCSHWTGYQREQCFIEFEEGFVPIKKVVEAIPKSFTGILDLSVCTAVPFADMVKKQFDDKVAVMCSSEKVRFEHWLRFYMLLFKSLTEKEARYLDAHCEIIEAMSKKYH